MHFEAKIPGYILAPVAVAPECQKKGIVLRLIRFGIEMLSNEGVDVLLVCGGPGFYGQFGFKREIACSFVPPYTLEYPFGWLGMMLKTEDAPDIPLPFYCVADLCKPDLW